MSNMNSLMHGLAIDSMEDDKALQLITETLPLIKGFGIKDLIFEYLAAGKVVDPILVSKMFYLDRMITITAAEVIQLLVDYRFHSCQKNHILDCLYSGKCYQGPKYNSTVSEAKSQSLQHVGEIVFYLFRVRNDAIDLLR